VRAFVIRGPLEGGVEDVPPPVAGAGQVVVEVARVGVCGTDVECFDGSMAYLATARIAFPLRIGHEWSGRVVELGDGVDASWLGRRTTGDTMLGCGRCRRCLAGRHHVCLELAELGFHPAWPGALAERVVVPVSSLHALPDEVDDAAGAMIEPAGNALRAARATSAASGDRVLVLGAGTIGLLAERFLGGAGVEAHVVGRSERSRHAARALGTSRVWGPDELPDLPWDAVIDATDDPASPALALDLVEPGGTVVAIGLAGEPSRIDTRTVALKDASIVGILGGSAGLDGAIAAFADGSVDPRPLIGATIGLDGIADALADMAAGRPATVTATGSHPGPKLQVDPFA
jgi:2-desacetyl-2-hydroxyethyl bacteriochlorophyllide A dehydrogenase